MHFRNPSNGYVETVSHPMLWTFLFGCFYFAFKGVWSHAVLGFVAAILTSGLSWFIYPLFAPAIMRSHYLRNGWTPVDEPNVPVPESTSNVEKRSPAEDERADRRIVRSLREKRPVMASTVLFWFVLAICGVIFLGAVIQIVDPEGTKARRAAAEAKQAAQPAKTENSKTCLMYGTTCEKYQELVYACRQTTTENPGDCPALIGEALQKIQAATLAAEREFQRNKR
jgi:hypothetical protein